MTILYIVLGLIALVYIAVTGFALLVNIFSAPGQGGFFGAAFHRCTTKDKILLSPGLLWVLPLGGVAYAIRKLGRR
jgi:hypothetical protein